MFQEILNRVYDVVGCDRMYVELKLFMRYPMPGKYVPIALEDDESLSAMWLSVTQTSAMAMEEHVDSDRDEDDDARNNDKAIKAGVPSQDWLRVDEVDQRTRVASLQQLKNFVKAWSISRNQMFRVLESEPTKYVIECARKEVCHCPWRLRAIMTKSFSFKIVRYVGPHASNCLGDITCGDHPLISSDFVADLIEDFIRTDPSFKVQSILTFVKNQYQFSITYKRAWLAKQKAISNIFGDWDKSYQELPDGTHLYGKYKGKLLIAMGTDANFQLFPLAFAVVEEESTEDWSWFLACIRRSVTDRKDLCVISDRHRGILAAMNEP
ncbi:uncharacterized protein LOC130589930 [Beta vulgaris subsp. vulgaris]|uniref:uncharacterized protein LOC130589930 n=1 Tax=Beta vulgaris subsp. vulgaris TaxID=3555 RepID=UPI002547F098|nr:uncharacterized protein LOC130589930 [Beta vulgaris subsp. vulgaris]